MKHVIITFQLLKERSLKDLIHDVSLLTLAQKMFTKRCFIVIYFLLVFTFGELGQQTCKDTTSATTTDSSIWQTDFRCIILIIYFQAMLILLFILFRPWFSCMILASVLSAMCRQEISLSREAFASWGALRTHCLDTRHVISGSLEISQ